MRALSSASGSSGFEKAVTEGPQYCGSAGSIPYDQLGFVRARADCSFATNEVMALITHDPLQEADLSG